MAGSRGISFLFTSDGGLVAAQIFQLYQKRWKVEESHIPTPIGSKAESGHLPVTGQDGTLAEEPPVCLNVGLCAARKVENRAQEEPLYPEGQNLLGSAQGSLGENSQPKMSYCQ
ncbi:MAG: hypothetical protein EPO28_14715 [Saprospiraceae bacterium]|nr:MAG: hypothetical protein EPO28_14715 [Saprospiraceae bacterium]